MWPITSGIINCSRTFNGATCESVGILWNSDSDPDHLLTLLSSHPGNENFLKEREENTLLRSFLFKKKLLCCRIQIMMVWTRTSIVSTSFSLRVNAIWTLKPNFGAGFVNNVFLCSRISTIRKSILSICLQQFRQLLRSKCRIIDARAPLRRVPHAFIGETKQMHPRKPQVCAKTFINAVPGFRRSMCHPTFQYIFFHFSMQALQACHRLWNLSVEPLNQSLNTESCALCFTFNPLPKFRSCSVSMDVQARPGSASMALTIKGAEGRMPKTIARTTHTTQPTQRTVAAFSSRSRSLSSWWRMSEAEKLHWGGFFDSLLRGKRLTKAQGPYPWRWTVTEFNENWELCTFSFCGNRYSPRGN